MSTLYLFAGSVFRNWFLYMTAGPFLLDEVFKRVCPKSRDRLGKHFPARTRRRIELALIIVGVFYAGFAAFNEEHSARENAEQKLQQRPTEFSVTEIDRQARSDLEKANKKIEVLESDLKEAREDSKQARTSASNAEIATRPKSLSERLRAFLDSLDPRITQELMGKTLLHVNGRLDFRKLQELQKLASEPGADQLYRLKPGILQAYPQATTLSLETIRLKSTFNIGSLNLLRTLHQLPNKEVSRP